MGGDLVNIICCYTRLNEATAEALSLWAPQCVLIPLPPEDKHAYWAAIASWWGTGHDLLIIEQDIVISPGTLPSMADCEGRSDWCAAPYPAYSGYRGHNERALGCTRFSARLQAAVPAEKFWAPWQQVADRFIALFDPLYPHQHYPVGHLRELPEGTAPWLP